MGHARVVELWKLLHCWLEDLNQTCQSMVIPRSYRINQKVLKRDIKNLKALWKVLKKMC